MANRTKIKYYFIIVGITNKWTLQTLFAISQMSYAPPLTFERPGSLLCCDTFQPVEGGGAPGESLHITSLHTNVFSCTSPQAFPTACEHRCYQFSSLWFQVIHKSHVAVRNLIGDGACCLGACIRASY